MGWAGGKVGRKFPLNSEEISPRKVLMKLYFHPVEIFPVHEIVFSPAGQTPPNFRRNFLLTSSHEIGPWSCPTKLLYGKIDLTKSRGPLAPGRADYL